MERRAYLVCMVQRSGSNVRCEALTRTGVAGRPTEYFVPAFPGSSDLHEHAGFERSRWAFARGPDAFDAFLGAVLREGATPSGVFGAKGPWSAFGALVDSLRGLRGDRPEREPLARAFGEARFVHLRRRDRVRQAVSWALAAATGRFASRDGPIAAWPAFFARAGLTPPAGAP